MNGPCPDRQDRIADYVLGALDTGEAQALQDHLGDCSGCRQYLQSLQRQSESLVELGREIDAGMTARQDRVIEALDGVAPAARRTFLSFGGFIKTAVAAVLLLGVGITIGRWTAPRPVDVGRLRSDLEASIQKSVLAQVDQRLQAEAQQRAGLARQTYQDLHALAEQSAAGAESLEKLMNGKFAELVEIIEAGREIDRGHIEKALLEMKEQTGLGLRRAVAVRAGNAATRVND